MPTKTFFLKFLLLTTIATLGFSKETPKMETVADTFFSCANISKGHASYSDEEGLSLIGGGGYLRNEVSNITPVTVTLPSLSVGCGGIDYRMGALSTVSCKEMKKVLENIAKGGASELFILALEGVSPQLATMTTKVQSFQNQINAININSCEIGSFLAQGMWPKGTASKERICRQASASQTFFRDRIEAKHGCRDNKNKGTIEAAQASEAEGILGENFNLAWRVIKDNDLSESQKFVGENDLHDLYLNISGTFISTSAKKDEKQKEKKDEKQKKNEDEKQKKKEKTEKVPPPKKASLQTFPSRAKEAIQVLMDGGVLEGAYKFGKEECLLLEKQKITILSGRKMKIEAALKSLADKIVTESRSESTTSLTEEEKDLMRNTAFPIAKLVSVLAQHNGKLSNSFLSLDQIAEQIAFDGVCSYVENVLTKLLSYTDGISQKQLEDSQIAPFKKELETTLSTLRYEKNRNLQQSSNWQNLLQFLIDVEKNLSHPAGGY